MALRYFYELTPDLHVIGAGSLLEFALNQEDFKMPVGRIQYMFMRPLSFLEFLDALGESKSREIIEYFSWQNSVQKPIHEHLISLIKLYSILGGMPAVVSEYAQTKNINKCLRIQSIITQTYRDDFGKYASRVKHKYLEKVFFSVPKMVGQKFKYSKVDSTMQSRDLKEALGLLEKAGIVHRVRKTSGSKPPLEAGVKEKYFKVVFLDIGLMQNLCGLSNDLLSLSSQNYTKFNDGSLAEQFVAGEIMSYEDYNKVSKLYFWARESRGSSAEVDYLINIGSNIYPVEVKASKTGTLKSMHLFLKRYNCEVGIKISESIPNNARPIMSIPFYAIKNISNLTQDLEK